MSQNTILQTVVGIKATPVCRPGVQGLVGSLWSWLWWRDENTVDGHNFSKEIVVSSELIRLSFQRPTAQECCTEILKRC